MRACHRARSASSSVPPRLSWKGAFRASRATRSASLRKVLLSSSKKVDVTPATNLMFTVPLIHIPVSSRPVLYQVKYISRTNRTNKCTSCTRRVSVPFQNNDEIVQSFRAENRIRADCKRISVGKKSPRSVTLEGLRLYSVLVNHCANASLQRGPRLMPVLQNKVNYFVQGPRLNVAPAPRPCWVV